MKLSIGYTTARVENEFQWFFDSLLPQIRPDDEIEIFIIDAHCEFPSSKTISGIPVTRYPVMPNVWSGKHRITKDNWWSVCASRNTFACLAHYPNIALVDDRCVVMQTWLQSVRESIEGEYCVAGSYEKRTGMTVENGVIKHAGIVIGQDSREDYMARFRVGQTMMDAPGEWLFGCTLALPLEWVLAVNGWPQILCDSVSMEDVVFGGLIAANNFPIKYDPRMRIIEDRTPERLGTPMKRTSKERHPHDIQDKAHEILRRIKGMKQSENPFGSLRELRDKIQRGGQFPVLNQPQQDWFDGQMVKDFQ